jgi:hypothetical protein
MARGFFRIVVGSILASAVVASSPAAARAAGEASFKTLEPGTLRVCLYAGFAPFASKDRQGRWQGWDVDYLAAFAQANALKLDVLESKFDGIWLAPGENVCDIAGTGISDTEDRRAAAGTTAVWSNTYYHVVRTFLVRTEQFARLARIDDLRGKRVLVTKGSTANSDICYRMAADNLHPCEKPDGDQPCHFKGLDLKVTPRASDRLCVDIEYPRDNEERNAAADVANSSDYSTFAYGGGYGSVQGLVCEWGKTQSLATVWPHCNMASDRKHAYAEPFSFVVRAADSALAHTLNCYINSHPYAGTPIPDLGCPSPPWTPRSDTACSR